MPVNGAWVDQHALRIARNLPVKAWHELVHGLHSSTWINWGSVICQTQETALATKEVKQHALRIASNLSVKAGHQLVHRLHTQIAIRLKYLIISWSC